MAARNRSNSDHTRLISKSIFVTNFPDNTSAKDLWEVCKGYGTVVDVFIPNRKSRSGKRFAFVRFIKVGNVDRLVENLCTLWIGRMHLHANVVRYDRPPISSSRPNVAPRPTVKSVSRPSANGASSFVSVLKGNPNTIYHISTSPAMVLDDECLVERDLDNFVLGEVKDFSSINNLLILLSNEGFQHVRLVYLGGLWVMIELPSIETKTRFMKHVGVASWFSQLRTAQSDFVSKERIVWIDIEGVPLHAWSRPTFSKIGSRWGEVLELEDNKDDCFARKRICIKTKQEDNILEKFKIIVRGKIFVGEKNDDMSKKVNLEDESDIEGVSETVFGNQDDPLVQELNQNSLPNEKEISSDPFNLYNLINKRDKGEENTGLDSSLPFPPGFTPADQVKSDRKNSPLHSHSGGLNSRVLEESQPTKDQGSPKDNLNQRVGGSILEVIDDMIKVGQAMGFTMEGSLGSKAKKDWIKELNNKHKVNFLSIQETKSDHISDMDIKSLWGNSKFDCTISESVVRCVEDRFGSEFNAQSANEFNCFISNSGLIEIQLEGYSFTWSLQSAKKMSKLDRFLVSDGLLLVFPHLSGICLDRHLSDHRPILLREVIFDYGSSPFRVYHSWLNFQDFDKMVLETWNNIDIDIDNRNKMVRFKKKLQILKKKIRLWVNDYRKKQSGHLEELHSNLRDIDKELDQGGTNEAKIQWAIEGDENYKFFHGIINHKRANLAIKGVIVDGDWVDDPCRVKEELRLHFANRFRAPVDTRYKLNYTFPNKLQPDQMATLESPVSKDEVRNTVWGCGENKSPGPDGFSFEFFLKFWDTVGSDFCEAVEWFFEHSSFSRGCNSSFIALIPKNQDPKFVNDYRPISLIGSLYKVVTKILANRLSSVIPGLISDVQTAFLPNRQILDGPFIINELLSWCKHKKQQAMVFKVDFAKAYDSIRWDFLEDVLTAFGFGPKWCSWIRGCLHSGMASVLLNGSPSSEFQFYCGLKQGDPLAPYLFLLVMESLHLSVSRAIEAGIFKGIKIDSTLNLSHLFYADDVVFIGEWSPSNLSGITNILHCFSLLSGLSINLKKSNLLGVGVRSEYVKDAAVNLGCLTMKTPFKYLEVMVGGICATSQAWEDTIGKLKARLSNWKLKTLSVGGRLTLFKSVLGSTPIYNLSIYKAPKSVLHSMKSLRRNFFNGSQCNERKIAWIKWTTTLASKKNGGLGISSLYALNRALLFKWVWRFISRDNSLWCRLILSMHGSKLPSSSPFRYSTWLSIIREIHSLKDRGVDLVSHCRIHVGNGLRTNFWKEVWIGDNPLCVLFPRIFALETNKDSSVAVKLSSVTSSLRRPVRGGSESSQLSLLQEYIEGTILSSLEDRWVWDLNGEGVFCVKDVRNLLDDVFLPKAPIATRWIKYVPIKLNVFAWKVHLNRLPTRVNLQHRGVLVSDPSCPICHSEDEDLAHLFFRCSLVTDIVRLVCRWWNIAWASIDSYSNWLHWLNAIRLSPKVKDLLEGVFYITWWNIWRVWIYGGSKIASGWLTGFSGGGAGNASGTCPKQSRVFWTYSLCQNEIESTSCTSFVKELAWSLKQVISITYKCLEAVTGIVCRGSKRHKPLTGLDVEGVSYWTRGSKIQTLLRAFIFFWSLRGSKRHKPLTGLDVEGVS
ncbi:RNA-directed DNA polymerase, eukaryota [Tanacetum coccineum]